MTRSHAHRVRPPEPDRLRPWDVIWFLLGLVMVMLTLVLGFASGPVPAA